MMIAAICSGAVAAGFAAVYGARAGGLMAGGWNWQFLPPLYIGWLAGLLIAIMTGLIASAKSVVYWQRLVWVVLFPMGICFIVSLVIYSLY